jgi:putative transposase
LRLMQYMLTPNAVYTHAAYRLRTHLRLTDFSPTCTASHLLLAVFTACARLCSLFAACGRLLRAPGAETIRKALLASLPDQDELERRLNRALAANLPRTLRRRRQRLAGDLHLRPYHGQPHADPSEIYRSQAKSGTSHFHAYATVYLVYRGQRFTVAVTVVRRGEALAGVLQRLLRQAARVGVRPCLLLLDRGFGSVAVLRYLQAARYPFLMPLVCRGRKADHPQGPSGSRVFPYWRRSGFRCYTLHDEDGRAATVSVCVACCNVTRRGRRRGRQRLVYAYWGVRPGSVAWVRQTYRQRFGIETSYRQLGEALPRTCTRNPVVRRANAPTSATPDIPRTCVLNSAADPNPLILVAQGVMDFDAFALGGAAVPGRGGVAAAQRVGVAALRRAVDPPARRAAHQPGAAAVQGVAADAAACGRGALRDTRRGAVGTLGLEHT